MLRINFPTIKKSRIVLSSKRELEGPSVGSRMDSVQSAEGFLMRQEGPDAHLRVKKWGAHSIRFYDFLNVEVKNSKAAESRILCVGVWGIGVKREKGQMKRNGAV